MKSADLSRLRITQAKRTEERAWLAEVSAVVLQQSLRDLDAAYQNFFDSLKGKRQGRKVGPPRYKSKKDTRQSGPRGVRPGPHPARQVRARRGMVRVRGHASVQGGSARAHLRQGGPGLPLLASLLGLRLPGRPQALARP
ncbi:hypothetical protein [Streptomyces triticisoli]|uniref:hypothetical protein n=1 Tax=Streptomyces triticisoli TaxID=2182797 RepID=UPI003F6A251F